MKSYTIQIQHFDATAYTCLIKKCFSVITHLYVSE